MRNDFSVLAVRLLVVALAVAASGWFILGVRAAHDQQEVGALVRRSGSLTPAQASRALRLLEHAGTLNPDRNVDILRAQVIQRTGDLADERRILKRVVGDEPKNIDAWVFLGFVPPPHNPDSVIAAARVRELAPPVPPPQ